VLLWTQVQTRSVELSERNVGDEPVSKPSVAQTSDILVNNNEDLDTVRNELIKVRSCP
jgi:hypothetical protein